MTDLDPEFTGKRSKYRVVSWLEKYERHISALSIIAAFIIDSTTLVRVDFAVTNIVLIAYLCVAALGNLAINLRESGGAKWLGATAYTWLLIAVQFSYGGLFGRFFIYYSRSGSLLASWPFLLILLVLLVGNEFAKRWYAKITLHMAFLYLALILYLTFAIPVLLGGVGWLYFVLSLALSLLIMHWYSLLARRIIPARYFEKEKAIKSTVIGICFVVAALYFGHVIPPLPLSLRDAGVYHDVRQTSTTFVAQGEEETFRGSLTLYPAIHIVLPGSVYVFSSVFAPSNFTFTVSHVWQRQDGDGTWRDIERIPFTVSGGREGGYRGYTFKRIQEPGIWRVNVETSEGQIVGRIGFTVARASTTPPLITTHY